MSSKSNFLEKFDLFVREIYDDAFKDQFILESGMSKLSAEQYIATTLGEARFTLSMLGDYDLQNKKILEVGAGAGWVSTYLGHLGLNIVCTEPGQQTFNVNLLLFNIMTRRLRLSGVNRLNLIITDLPENIGPFDLIFSNNVMEHVENIESSLFKLHSLLSKNGIMVHNCPNYLFPYEPHLGIPLVPFWPKLTLKFFPAIIKDIAIWNSVNFIKFSDIKRAAHRCDAEVSLAPGILFKTIRRILSDIEFQKRHPKLTVVFKMIDKIKLLRLFYLMPAFLSTPMIFTWEKIEHNK